MSVDYEYVLRDLIAKRDQITAVIHALEAVVVTERMVPVCEIDVTKIVGKRAIESLYEAHARMQAEAVSERAAIVAEGV